MKPRRRPHLLGIDDGPFAKRARAAAPIVGVMTAGADVVEGVAMTRFGVDGDGATEFLAAWVAGLRVAPALQAIVLGGITIAGLGIVDMVELARHGIAVPDSVTRRDPQPEPSRRRAPRRAARRSHRGPRSTPPAVAVDRGVWIRATAGTPAATRRGWCGRRAPKRRCRRRCGSRI